MSIIGWFGSANSFNFESFSWSTPVINVTYYFKLTFSFKTCASQFAAFYFQWRWPRPCWQDPNPFSMFSSSDLFFSFRVNLPKPELACDRDPTGTQPRRPGFTPGLFTGLSSNCLAASHEPLGPLRGESCTFRPAETFLLNSAAPTGSGFAFTANEGLSLVVTSLSQVPWSVWVDVTVLFSFILLMEHKLFKQLQLFKDNEDLSYFFPPPHLFLAKCLDFSVKSANSDKDVLNRKLIIK